MNFISAWAPFLLLLLPVIDRIWAVLVGALLISAHIIGTTEAAFIVMCGTALTILIPWVWRLRREKQGNDLPILPCDYTIRQWLKRHGIVKSVLLIDLSLAWKLQGTLTLSRATDYNPKVLGLHLTVAALVTGAWILLLTPMMTWCMLHYSTLIQVRMILPGLILLSLMVAVVLRTALCRFYQRFRENRHENLGR